MSTKEINSIEKMEMAESSSNQKITHDAYLIKKKYAYIIFAAVCLFFVGSILATYFGKPGKYLILLRAVDYYF